jgi:O-succinylbenzoic acid--CoA ligase
VERAELRAWVLSTGCAEIAGDAIFLCDPHWTAAERAQLSAIHTSSGQDEELSREGWLCLPTGGTSGGVRFCRHDELTLSAAVRGFCAFFEIAQVNTIDVLPPHHVSGLMARVRSSATGGRHVGAEWKAIEAGRYPHLIQESDGWVISLVPTQLQRLLGSLAGAGWLRQFRLVLVGGAPLWPELEQMALAASLTLAVTYGMTETAAMIAAVCPRDFRNGETKAASILPHAAVSLSAEGTIKIKGESVFRGYFPERSASREFETQDLGEMDAAGRVVVLGRKDAVIISGGKKIQPEEVEQALRATGRFTDVAVIGVVDPEWGQSVVACYPASTTPLDLAQLRVDLEGRLASYKLPKRYIPISEWLRNAQGKINRAKLAELAARLS